MLEGITGIILAGGASSRMGQPKALVPWGQGSLIDAVIASLLPIADEVLIVAKDASPFMGRGARVVTDFASQSHPVVGLYSGLLLARHEVSFVCACDMPWLQPDVIRYLHEALNGFDAVVPQGPKGGLEPLHAIYTRRCVAALEHCCEKEAGALQDVLGRLRLRIVTVEELRRIESWERSFVNLNTPTDCQNDQQKTLLDSPDR